MAVPLFQIPIIATTLGLHYVSFSSPTPPASGERERGGFLERTIMRNLSFESWMQKGLVTTVGLAEATILFAHAFPHLAHDKLVTYTAPYSTSSLLPFAIGTSLVILGSVLRKWCFRTMGHLFTFEINVQKEHKLVTWGPYAYVRHPSYTGATMAFVGVAVWQGSWFKESGVLDSIAGRVFVGFATLWNVILAAAFLARVPIEDRLMKDRFGAQWDAWAKKVSYRIMPYVY